MHDKLFFNEKIHENQNKLFSDFYLNKLNFKDIWII